MTNPKTDAQTVAKRRILRGSVPENQAILTILGEIAAHLSELNNKLAVSNARLQVIERSIRLLSSLGIGGGFRN